MIYKITLTMLLCTAVVFNTTFAQQLKLIGKTHATYRGSGSYTEDSVHYYHSGTKTNSINKYKIPEFQFMEDSSHTYKYNTTSKTLEWEFRTVSTYTGTDFKESIRYEKASNGGWDNDLRTTIKYKGGKPDTVTYETWSSFGSGSWFSSSRIIYTWSGNNVLTRHRQRYQKSGGGGGGSWSWRDDRMWTYTYSGNNEMSFIDQKYSGGNWVDTTKRETMYAAGKVSQVDNYKSDGSGGWTPLDRSIYTRDGQSRLILIHQDIYNGTAWEANQRDTMEYLANNTSSNVDTMTSYAFLFGSINNKGKWFYDYISKTDGRLTSETSLSWDGIGAWKQTDNQDSINKWYYGWNLSVNDVEANNNSVNVYPSPATNTINISLSDFNKEEQIHFAIVDIQGRLMKNWLGSAKAVTTMSIDELPAGNYILKAEAASQKGARMFTVSK